MANGYYVVIRVISQKGTCGAGHKVGDQWIMGSKTPEGICAGAFGSILLNARVLRFGGTFPFSADPDTAIIACPDHNNPVVFEIRRGSVID